MTEDGQPTGSRWPEQVSSAPWAAGLTPVMLAMGAGGLWRFGPTYWPGWIFVALGTSISLIALVSQRRAEMSAGLDAAGTSRLAMGLVAGTLAGGVIYFLLFELFR